MRYPDHEWTRASNHWQAQREREEAELDNRPLPTVRPTSRPIPNTTRVRGDASADAARSKASKVLASISDVLAPPATQPAPPTAPSSPMPIAKPGIFDRVLAAPLWQLGLGTAGVLGAIGLGAWLLRRRK